MPTPVAPAIIMPCGAMNAVTKPITRRTGERPLPRPALTRLFSVHNLGNHFLQLRPGPSAQQRLLDLAVQHENSVGVPPISNRSI